MTPGVKPPNAARDPDGLAQTLQDQRREIWLARFPGTMEHALRLVSERLIHCLQKPQGVDLADPQTWPAEPREILDLALALESLITAAQTWQPPRS